VRYPKKEGTDKIGQTAPKLAKTYNFFQQLSQTINKWKVSFWAGVGLHKNIFYENH
jgi:hypothetical protein